jgi:predicted TPR repeat methyltransferase
MLLSAGRPREALAAYRATLAREPGRARSYYGAGRAAQLAGDREAAAKAYGQYLQAMEGGDGRRPEQDTARAFLQGVRATSS